mmetsp:Transcript_25008/g.28822  ORF Transcript_25008/g.28822 Transcript_25008/m.28822 type:complete len:226 (+) Transcript_25008:158-835(+)
MKQVVEQAQILPMTSPNITRGPQHENITKSETTVPLHKSPSRIKAMSQTPHQIVIRHRINLFVMIKILFKYLNRIDPALATRAQNLLKDCNKQNAQRQKQGKSSMVVYGNLADTIERRVRLCVGDAHWQRAQNVCRKQNIIIGAKVEEQVREKKRKLMEQTEQLQQQVVQKPSKKAREMSTEYEFNVGSGFGVSSIAATSKASEDKQDVKIGNGCATQSAKPSNI